MGKFDIFFNSMRHSISAIGSLPCSSAESFGADGTGKKVLAVSSGVESSDENWAWIPPQHYSKEVLSEVTLKFEECSVPFVLPQFPNTPPKMMSDLDDADLRVRTEYQAMIFDFDSDIFPTIECNENFWTKKISAQEAEIWAGTCWRAFDETRLPPSFHRLTQCAAESADISLFLAYFNENPVGTFILYRSENCFTSHFAVVPEARRQGVGGMMLTSLMNEAKKTGNTGSTEKKCRYLTLLATKQGELLYRKFGFRDIVKIPLRSFECFTTL